MDNTARRSGGKGFEPSVPASAQHFRSLRQTGMARTVSGGQRRAARSRQTAEPADHCNPEPRAPFERAASIADDERRSSFGDNAIKYGGGLAVRIVPKTSTEPFLEGSRFELLVPQFSSCCARPAFLRRISARLSKELDGFRHTPHFRQGRR